MTDSQLEALLESWAAWARGSRPRYGSCGSAEKFYRPERVADDEQRQPTVHYFTLNDVLMCERAVCSLPVPYRLMTVMIWRRNFPPPMALRRAKVQPLSRGCGWPFHRQQCFGLLRQSFG